MKDDDATSARPPGREPPASAGGSQLSPEQRLRTSEERLRMLIESASDYAIFSMDLSRKVNYWNSGAERVFGYREDEILGEAGDIIFTPEDRAQGAPQQEAGTALAEGRAADERWHLRKNGQRFFASGVMTPLRGDDGTVHGFVKIARDLTEKKVAEDRLRAAREELERRVQERTTELDVTNRSLRREIEQRQNAEESRHVLLRKLATAHEEERLRLSRELHDEIGQHLAALMLGLNSLEPVVRATSSVGILRQLQDLTETIGREVHALAVQLRPTSLDDLGLVRALTTYVEVWSGRSGIKAELHAANLESPRLPPDVEVTLYRLVQEALTNVLKHAAATRVSLIFNRQDGDVVAIIEDNGRGFDPEAQPATTRKGLGLLGMKERVAQLNGRVDVESAMGQGTTLFVRIPLL